MLVNRRAGLLLVLPPKTASTSLVAALDGVQGWEWPEAYPGAPWWVSQHTPFPPPGCDGFRVHLAVRKPVARAVSMFRAARDEAPRHPAVATFGAFVAALTGAGPGMVFPDWRLTCSAHLAVNPGLPPRLAGLVRTERLAGDLAALGVTAAPPRLHRSRSPAPAVAPGERARLLAWGAADLRLYDRFAASAGVVPGSR